MVHRHMTNETHAFVSDLTPNRATIEALGDETDLRGRFEDRCDGRVIRVPADSEVGERVWILTSEMRPN